MVGYNKNKMIGLGFNNIYLRFRGNDLEIYQTSKVL